MVTPKPQKTERSHIRKDASKEKGTSIRSIGSWVNQLLARRGYAQVTVNEAMASVISEVLGEGLENAFQIGNLKAGKLQIYTEDSVTLQELNFRKRDILAAIRRSFPDSNVSEVRFRIHAK